MKTPKPGQFCTIKNKVYRAKKRTYGCSGCALNNPFFCPNIGRRNGTQQLDCVGKQIILVRV